MQVRDCVLTLSVKDGIVGVKSENCSMLELSMLAGYLQIITGFAAFKNGKDVEEIKTDMLGLYADAMLDLEKQISRK